MLSKNYMVVIIKQPNKKSQVVKIPKKLIDLEKIVGGTVEEKRYDKVLLIYKEKQDDITLEDNKLFEDVSLKGTVIIAGNNENVGDVRSLSKREVIKYLKKLNCKNINREQGRENE